MSFKSISQTDTIKKIVLTENIAREVIKDLVKGDVNKKIVLLQDKEIDNLNNIIIIKDSIINVQKEYISIQKKMIHAPSLFSIHSNIGMRTVDLLNELPSIYANLVLGYRRINLGIAYSVQQYNKPNTGVLLEFKLF